jgi:hypothetical protein
MQVKGFPQAMSERIHVLGQRLSPAQYHQEELVVDQRHMEGVVGRQSLFFG